MFHEDICSQNCSFFWRFWAKVMSSCVSAKLLVVWFSYRQRTTVVLIGESSYKYIPWYNVITRNIQGHDIESRWYMKAFEGIIYVYVPTLMWYCRWTQSWPNKLWGFIPIHGGCKLPFNHGSRTWKKPWDPSWVFQCLGRIQYHIYGHILTQPMAKLINFLGLHI